MKITRKLGVAIPVAAALAPWGFHAPPKHEAPAERPPIVEFQRVRPENRLILLRTLREAEARRLPIREEPHTPHKKFKIEFELPKAVLKGPKVKR